ncbi:MAG: efflux RND transporter periplasmic adaptor subunit [Phycisphaerae bacterium]|nr:efflux RND transporter periplasmic adaptor subunit [Phycisphaerae bacterium]
MTVTTAPSRPDTGNGVRGVLRRRPTRSHVWLGLAGLVVLAALAYAALRAWWPAASTGDPTVFVVQRRSFSVDLPQKGELQAAQSVDVRCEVEGRSTIIWLIHEGAQVQKGDLLVEMASDEIEDRIKSEEINVANAESNHLTAQTDYEIQIDQNASDIRKAELALENAKTELSKYEEGDWIQQQTDARIAVQRAEKELKQAADRFKDSKELNEQGFITKREYESDEFSLFVAEKELEQAKLAEEILHKYTYTQTLRQKQSDVEEADKELERVRKGAAAKEAQKKQAFDSRTAELAIARDRLAKYRRQKENTRIVAPAPGLVVYYAEPHRWGDGDEIKEGAEVRERQTLITLPDTSRMKVIVRIHEAAATRINLGLPATVEIEGHPGRVFAGAVTKVAELADSQNRWLNPDLKEYETEITLDEPDLGLKPGVTARARIHITDVANALAVPVQAVFSKGGSHYVFRSRRGGGEPVPVKLGASSEEYVEVLDGVREGDRILLAVSEDLKREIPSREEPPNNARPSETSSVAHQPKTTPVADRPEAASLGVQQAGARPAGRPEAAPGATGQAGGPPKGQPEAAPAGRRPEAPAGGRRPQARPAGRS